MPSFEVRPFRRVDRDQLTELVNGHAAAVMPGASVSVNTVLNQLEREPGEFIVGPWMSERLTLVAEQDGSIVAAALLVRYRADADVGEGYRNAGDIRWLLFRPLAPAGNPWWHDGWEAAEAILAECLRTFDRWSVGPRLADVSLPVPGVYGVPEQWPHVAELLERNGFRPSGPTESVYLVELARVAEPGPPPLAGLELRRSLGINGTRLSGLAGGDRAVGFIEVDLLDQAERHPRGSGVADVGNLWVDADHQRRGIGTWLLGHAAAWLRLGRVDRLLDYTHPEEEARLAFLAANGFHEITRCRKGWALPAAQGTITARPVTLPS